MKKNNTDCIEKHLDTWPCGIKRTKQRADVYDVLLNAQKPLSAVEIYNKIELSSNDIKYAVSTIYRILATFEENNIVMKSTLMGNDTAVYELNKGVHKHYAICLGCHKLTPLKECPVDMSKIETDDNEFTVTNHKIEVYGYCNKCKLESSKDN